MVEQEPGNIEEQNDVVRQEGRIGLPVSQADPFIEKIGFVDLRTRLRNLNYVLARIAPSRPVGFSMEIKPDIETAQIDFKPHVENPFKIEIAGSKDNFTLLRISTREYLYRNGSIELADIQQFVQESFPDREALFHAAPIIQYQEIEMNRVGSRRPQDLYEEERDAAWREKMQESKKRTTEYLLEGLLPVIDEDLHTVTEEQIKKLSERIAAVKINATFYSEWSENPKRRKVNRREEILSPIEPQLYNSFDVILEGQAEEPLLQISLFPLPFGENFLVFQRLFYRGTPEEVEKVIEKFSEMMKNTPGYARFDEDVE
jgi:hypothetical protein